MMRRWVVSGLLALGGLLAFESTAVAQEIQLTGPLAGAPAVRGLRWHRNKRFEVAPMVSFTLLNEFKHTILAGAKLNYNLTDWLAVGAWGAFGVAHINTGLTDEVEKVNKDRWKSWDSATADAETVNKTLVDRNATVLSIGKDFPSQTGTIQWVFAPQVTAVPFRGKLAIFQKVFVDTELYFFGGPAFVGLKERADFDPGKEQDRAKLVSTTCTAPVDNQMCVQQPKYETATRVAIAPTFGFGLSFFTGKWTGIGLEYRAMPFAWNNSGFDSRGGPPDDRGPDYKVDEKDRAWRFNQMISVSFNMFFPTAIKSSP